MPQRDRHKPLLVVAVAMKTLMGTISSPSGAPWRNGINCEDCYNDQFFYNRHDSRLMVYYTR